MMHTVLVFYVLQEFTNHLGQNIKEKRSLLHTIINNQGCGIKNKRSFFLLLDLMCRDEGWSVCPICLCTR